MKIELPATIRGLITKAHKGTASRSTVFHKIMDFCQNAGIPRQQAKHFTRKALAA